MGEFLWRWVGVGGVFLGMMVWVRGVGLWSGVPAAMFVGFANALMRGVMLRVGLGNPVWELALGLAVLNAGLMLGLGAVGGMLGAGWRSAAEAWVSGGVVFGVSWAMSCVFRDHAGDWHWITHHGRVLQIRQRRRRRVEGG
jgi:hypothetical protein